MDVDLHQGPITSRRAIWTWVDAWNAFWFAEIPPDLFAILRILFGLVGCLTIVGLLNVQMFWTCSGLVASRGSSICGWSAARGLGWLPGSFILLSSSVSFLAMLIGYHTRVAVACAYISVTLLAKWNDLPLSAAHQALRAFLFCLVWADGGRVCSLDAILAGTVGQPKPVPIWPLRLIQIQVAAIYLVTGLWKLNNVMWRDGSALHYVFENPQFRRFAVLASPSLDLWTTLATYGTLVWELSFAFLILHPRSRRLALAIGVAVHLSLWLLLELGTFSWVMLASYVAFFDPRFVRQRLSAWARTLVRIGLGESRLLSSES